MISLKAIECVTNSVQYPVLKIVKFLDSFFLQIALGDIGFYFKQK